MDDGSIKAEISEAIGAHSSWKIRLRASAMRGGDDLNADEVRRDDRCQFGAWLAGLPASGEDGRVARIRAAHSAFHAEAGRIVDLIGDGRGDEAVQALDCAGYHDASTRLLRLLAEWKRTC